MRQGCNSYAAGDATPAQQGRRLLRDRGGDSCATRGGDSRSVGGLGDGGGLDGGEGHLAGGEGAQLLGGVEDPLGLPRGGGPHPASPQPELQAQLLKVAP